MAVIKDKQKKGEEDAWFNANEQKIMDEARRRKEAGRAKLRAKESDQKRKELKELHWLKCAKCGHDMKERVLACVTIEVCTYCGGYHLDDGELEMLLKKKDAESKGFLKKLFGVK